MSRPRMAVATDMPNRQAHRAHRQVRAPHGGVNDFGMMLVVGVEHVLDPSSSRQYFLHISKMGRACSTPTIVLIPKTLKYPSSRLLPATFVLCWELASWLHPPLLALGLGAQGASPCASLPLAPTYRMIEVEMWGAVLYASGGTEYPRTPLDRNSMSVETPLWQ